MKSIMRRFGKPRMVKGRATIQNKNKNPPIGPSPVFAEALKRAMEKGKEGEK